MTPDPSTDGPADDVPALDRRDFVAAGVSLGALALAGCTGDGGSPTDGAGDDPGTDASTRTADTGTFRLLISDRPNAIDDFDSLDVSFEKARVFRRADEDTPTSEPTATASATERPANGTKTPTATPAATATDAESEDDTEGDGDDAADDADGEDDASDDGGFTTMDLDGATVDLTEVVGAKATGIFEGGLAAGTYTKVELHAAEVAGVVDGEPADVKLPSGKLMLTKPFTLEAGSSVSFVFDISVVKKGNGGYNLLPVVSESGVAGKDVEVEEVGGDAETVSGTATNEDGSEAETGADRGPSNGNDNGDQAGGTPTPE